MFRFFPLFNSVDFFKICIGHSPVFCEVGCYALCFYLFHEVFRLEIIFESVPFDLKLLSKL